MRTFLVAFLVATSALGDQGVYATPDPPPDVFAPLTWRTNGKDAYGFWFTDAQVQKIDLRIRYLEDKAAKECTDATNAETKKVVGSSSTLWIIGAAALVVGVFGGIYAAHHF